MNTLTVRNAIDLPAEGGSWRQVVVRQPRAWEPGPAGFSSRVAFAAAHVAADPRGSNVPGAPAAVDWDATLAFRQELLRYGFGIAEAMDTAQRNMGLDWPAVQELVRRSADQARSVGGRIASGAGTDHVVAADDVDAVLDAYREQVEFVESTGSQVIVMASRHLARVARSADDYLSVYTRLLDEVSEPVILHWLGTAFDPQLHRYWGSSDVMEASATFLELLRSRSERVDGVKVSLLSAEHEVWLRAQLPDGIRLYTGDDFNYPTLIRGDGDRHSDALLGAFAAVAPAASAALGALDRGDLSTYDEVMGSTLELSRHLFEAPTYYYKTGIAFLAWLNGHQRGFTMVGGLQSARDALHLSRLFALANDAQLLRDPELASRRMRQWLDVHGVVR